MTLPGHGDLRDRLRRALPPAMKARDRPAVTALRSALAAIDNAGAVDPAHAPPAAQAPLDRGPLDQAPPDQAPSDRGPLDQDPANQDPADQDPANQDPANQAPANQDPPVASSAHRPQASAGAAQPTFAGTVAGVGATEVERRSLSQAQMEAIVRVEIADRETAATGYERAGQLDRAERLRAEAEVLLAHLDTT